MGRPAVTRAVSTLTEGAVTSLTQERSVYLPARRSFVNSSLPESTLGVLQRVEQQFPSHVTRAQSTTDLASLGFRVREVEEALAATKTALAEQQSTGSIHNDAPANALRAAANYFTVHFASVRKFGGGRKR